jgi:glucose 1-dehydrogenase
VVASVLVTGGSRGIGDAVCERFLRDGFNVISWDLQQSSHDAVHSQIVDVTVWEEVRRAGNQLPPLHAAVTCAGIGLRGSFDQLGIDELRRVIDVNFFGTANTALAALSALKSGRGTLVTIGSIAAINGFHQRAGYSSSKAAVVALTKSLANEWAEDGVRTVCVSPGFTQTEMMSKSLDSGLTDYNVLIRHTPQRCIMEPEAIADAVAALASDDFRRLTGAHIVVDAGWDSLSGF